MESGSVSRRPWQQSRRRRRSLPQSDFLVSLGETDRADRADNTVIVTSVQHREEAAITRITADLCALAFTNARRWVVMSEPG